MIETPDGPSDGKYHIAIAIPTHEMVPHQFASALSAMVGYTIHEIGELVNLTTHFVVGTYVHKAREQLLDEISEMGAHYILWLDSDHNFPKDLLIRLMAHDVEMVGINYTFRSVPARYVAFERTTIDHQEDGLGGKLLETKEDSHGLAEVEALGFGAVLMKMVIVPTLPKNKPRFFFEWNEEKNIHVGEDVWFCRLITQAGWNIYVDHDLSKECTHIGQIQFRLNHVWAQEEIQARNDLELQRTADSGGELAESE